MKSVFISFDVQCNAKNAATTDENCLSCLPVGYVACGAAG